ncbi:MAG: putative ABC transporter permease [Gaiellaceae bacterium]
MKPALMRRTARFLAYGLVGWTIDSLYVWAHTGRRRPSSLFNVPVYGLAQPLFEPLHDRVRPRSPALRGALYASGILGVEYVSGRLLRRLRGSAPWDYGTTRFAVDGLVRLDYAPLWAAYGMALELLHDALTGRKGTWAGPRRIGA